MPVLNALTVDVEDWYHVCAVGEFLPAEKWSEYESRVNQNCEKILDLLRRHDTKVTFFVLGYVAEQNPELVRRFHEEGHEIATHGYLHQRLIDLGPPEFHEDLRASLRAIRSAVDCDIFGYRAPEWTVVSRTAWAYDILVSEGFRYDSSTVPLTMMGDRSFPRFPHIVHTPAGRIWEFPATTMRCLWENFPYTGGLPLRMSPFWFTVSGIRRLNRIGYPAMVYMHPWEFDENPPQTRLPAGRQFMHTYLMKSVPRKIEGLLERFRFGPIRDVLKL
jgi:polysaccharide deacetylase family protein (PEP-CTERM system associated)